MRRVDGPHVRVYQGQTATELPATVYEELTHMLQAGFTWWEGPTLYGHTILLRLSTVSDVNLYTAEGLAERANEPAEPEGWNA